MERKLINQNILIVSNEPWGDVWYSKHNWAFELSKSNHVIFVNPPGNWKFKNLFKCQPKLIQHSISLQILDYKNILPFTRFSFLYKVNELLTASAFKRFFKSNQIEDYIFWSFDPFRFSKPNLLKPKFSIFHITDLFSTKRERDIIKNVDYLISVNKTLIDNFSDLNKKTLVVPHGISTVQTPFLNTTSQMILIGTFTDRVKINLLEKIAVKFPDTKIVLYGPQFFKQESNLSFFNKLITRKNIDYLGYGSIKNIEKELKESKIALALYTNDNIGNRLNSLKIIQYLSYGKNVVTTFFEDYSNIAKNNLIKMTDDEDQYLQLCEEILREKEDIDLIEKRIEYSQKFLYSNLIKQIENFLK